MKLLLPTHGKIYFMGTSGKDAGQDRMSQADMQAFSTYIYGEAVLDRVFDRPIDEVLQVYSVETQPVEALRARIGAQPRQSLIVTSSRRIATNCDYWFLDRVDGVVETLSPERPVGRTFAIEDPVEDSDITRIAHYLMSWPWETVDADVSQLAARVRARSSQFPSEFEVEVLGLGYTSGAEFVDKLGKVSS